MTAKPPITPQQLAVLHRILQEEIVQADRTAEKLMRKKEYLLNNQPKELARIDQELLALSRKSKQLEAERIKLMSELGYSNQPLEKLIQTLDPPNAAAFALTREQLRRALLEVAQLNRESRDLLDLSIRWIQETVELIANALTPEAASYNAQGGKQRKPGDSTSIPVQSTVNHSA